MIKIGMTVRAVVAVMALGKDDSVVELAEGDKGTVLALDGSTAFLRLKDGRAVFCESEKLAGCKGRPLTAEGITKALAALAAAEAPAATAEAAAAEASGEVVSEAVSEPAVVAEESVSADEPAAASDEAVSEPAEA